MAQAVALLRDEGTLVTRQGRGIHLADGTRPPQPGGVVSEGYQWQRVEAQLAEDISNGRYPGMLPSYKELQANYRVSYRTLKKALSSLAQRGVLSPDHRRYRPSRPHRQRARNTVVLIAGGTEDGELQFYTQRTHDNLRAFESYCSRANVSLKTLSWDSSESRLFAMRTAAGRDETRRSCTSALGFAVWTSSFTQEQLDTLLRFLNQFKRPVAILFEGALLSASAVLDSRIPLKQFAVAASSRDGWQVGRFLYDLGHRRVAYVSPLHDSAWSRLRLKGLRESFAMAGSPEGVLAFTDTQPPRFGERGVLHDIDGTVLVEDASALTTISQYVQSMRHQLTVLIQRETYRDTLRKLVLQAIEHREVTAWIAANDNFAIECIEFLRHRGIDVPGGISVVGFDDSMEGFLRKLTSYNYNDVSALHAMLEHILHPRPRGRAPDRSVITEPEGFVNVRETVGKRGI